MKSEEPPKLVPIAALDPFGTAEKYRSCRIVVEDGHARRKLCWVVFAPDGSVSAGLSDPGLLITEIGDAHADQDGRLTKQPQASALPTVVARTAPHVTLHRSGVCHVRARGQAPLARTTYENWFPPTRPFEWFQLFSSPVRSLIAVPARSRDALVPSPGANRSLAIRFDLLPRSYGSACPILDGVGHTVVGVAPEYALRVSLFSHPPVQPEFLLRTGQ